jgi:hypothetical protein
MVEAEFEFCSLRFSYFRGIDFGDLRVLNFNNFAMLFVETWVDIIA